jgi:hypothetical protein
MHLHHFAAAAVRPCASGGAPLRIHKVRILSNEAEFSQDIQFERCNTQFQTVQW